LPELALLLLPTFFPPLVSKPPPPFPSNRLEFLGTIVVRFCPQWEEAESSLDDDSDDDIHFEDDSPIVWWTFLSPKYASHLRRRRFRRLSGEEEEEDDDDAEAVAAKSNVFLARNVFLFFSILALAFVLHLLDLGNNRDEFILILVLSLDREAFEVPPEEEEDNNEGVNISSCGEFPHKKGSISQQTCTRRWPYSWADERSENPSPNSRRNWPRNLDITKGKEASPPGGTRRKSAEEVEGDSSCSIGRNRRT